MKIYSVIIYFNLSVYTATNASAVEVISVPLSAESAAVLFCRQEERLLAYYPDGEVIHESASQDLDFILSRYSAVGDGTHLVVLNNKESECATLEDYIYFVDKDVYYYFEYDAIFGEYVD